MIRLFNHNIWGGYAEGETVGNRCQLIGQEISRLQPDICCFQECSPYTMRPGENGMQQLMQQQYEEVCPEKAGENFTPVFLKKGVFEICRAGHILYPGLNDMNSKSVTYAVLLHKQSGKRFCVASTHFWWQRGEQSELQRQDNARVLGALAKRLCDEEGVPFVVSGDFNSGKPPLGQGLAGYDEMLRQGFRDVRFACEVPIQTHTVRENYPIRMPDDTYVGGTAPTFTIDYVFTYGAGITGTHFDVITTQNVLNSSDHCPLLYDFEINN